MAYKASGVNAGGLFVRLQDLVDFKSAEAKGSSHIEADSASR
jgi:hypothetical protein